MTVKCVLVYFTTDIVNYDILWHKWTTICLRFPRHFSESLILLSVRLCAPNVGWSWWATISRIGVVIQDSFNIMLLLRSSIIIQWLNKASWNSWGELDFSGSHV